MARLLFVLEKDRIYQVIQILFLVCSLHSKFREKITVITFQSEKKYAKKALNLIQDFRRSGRLSDFL